MRRLVPQVNCDFCSNDMSPEDRATVFDLSYPGAPERLVGDLCPVCLDDLRDKVNDAVAHYLSRDTARSKKRVRPGPKPGAIAARNAAGRGPVDDGTPESLRTCTICAIDAVEYIAPNRSALGQHLKARHQTTFSKLGQALPGGKNSAVAKSKVKAKVK